MIAPSLQTTGTPTKKRLLVELLFLCATFAAVCFPLVFSDRETNYSQDELNYHVPAIRQIARHWPSLDIAQDSLSATAPGYHYALATVSKFSGDSTRTLRLLNWLVSVDVLVLLFVWLRNSLPLLDSALALLPLLLSNFFVKSASWVVTDNAALLLVAVAFILCLRSTSRPGWWFSLVSASAVFVRQMAVWLVVLPLAGSLVRQPSETDRRRQLAHAGLLALPALTVLALLCWSWGGLVPPVWRTASMQISTAGPLYLLSVLGLFAAFYFWFSLDLAAIRRDAPAHRIVILASATAFVLWLATASDANAEQGRWGGYLWNLSAYFPAVAARNALFLLLSQLGALSLVFVWSTLRRGGHARDAALFLLAVGSWAATFVVNRQVFHRYFEPTILVLLISLAPKLLAATEIRARARFALLAATLLQLGITLATAYRTVYG